MTAIAGLWRFDRRPGCAADCDRMLAAQEMYGPDDRAQWSDSTVALGRQLFRILPEDDEDRGPVVSRDGQTVLVADVRLDNRAELIAALGKSAADARYLCDANLLLACIEHWSMGALDRVVGDFAFALWDGRRQQMTLARDFMGQKPLHYHCGKGFFAFASMAKGLHALSDIPYAPDEQTMAEFLALMPQSGPRSFFQDISRIEQGHVVTITREGVSSRRYWNPTRPARGAAAPRDWVEGVRHHLDMATQARLRGAGGSIGSHLSSGFDSSAVTATAARMMASDGGRVTAFTSVPSVLPDNPAKSSRILDEGPLAAATAALYPNIEHVKLKTGHMSPMDGMDRSFHLFERPRLNLCNWVWMRQFNEEARRRKIDVMLHGTMGNMSFSYSGLELLPELFREGRWGRLFSEYSAMRSRTGAGWRGLAALTLGPYLSAELWGSLSARFRGYRDDVFHYSAINRDRFAELNLDAFAKARDLDLAYRPRKDAFEDRMWVLNRTDPGNNNKGTLGGWGIDMRDPTADRRLVEYCLSIPTDQYLVKGVTRAVAKAALRDRLPDVVLDAKKRGYQASDWHLGLTGDAAGAASEIDRIGHCAAAARTLDIDRMRHLADSLPTGNWQDRGVIRAYRLALLRGISAGHFLRKATRSNG
jgi:asparagine synthase (glutamine-hydrolysing)